jgi:hypothetical protein
MARHSKQPTVADASSEASEPEFQPKTELGRRLWELRKQIVASGEPLLEREDLEREIAERRGGVSARELGASQADSSRARNHCPQDPRAIGA